MAVPETRRGLPVRGWVGMWLQLSSVCVGPHMPLTASDTEAASRLCPCGVNIHRGTAENDSALESSMRGSVCAELPREVMAIVVEAQGG